MAALMDNVESQAMGRTTVELKLTNAEDLGAASRGLIPQEQVRKAQVIALVDTGASMLNLPISTIAALGLRKLRERMAVTAAGPVTRGVYSPVELDVMGRQVIVEVMELSDGVPALLGYLPLESLDLIVNPKKQALEGNPEHDGRFVVDLY